MPCQQPTHACVKAYRARVGSASFRRRRENGMLEKLIRYLLVIVLAWSGATLFFALQLPGLRLEPDTEA